jgi:phenylalanyl-tRNA synthetase alpha chain
MKYDKIIRELSQNEKKVLLTLKKLNGKSTPVEIMKEGSFNHEVEIMNASSWLQSKKLVKIKEIFKKLYYLGDEGLKYSKEGLPEIQALKYILKNNGKIKLKDLNNIFCPSEIPIAIGWLVKKKIAIIKKVNGDSFIEITEKGSKLLTNGDKDEIIIKKLYNSPNIEVEISSIKNLLSRKNVIKQKDYINNIIYLTELGEKLIKTDIEIKDEISNITNSIIIKADWKNKIIRPYDIHSFSPSKFGGKSHPLVDLILKIKQIFLELGFHEIEGDYVESSFWNMDVLFIPQDHPAREMQDTLYLKTPNKININDKDLLNKIKEIHENGGVTTSTGWGYKFINDEGKKPLLRTHTTVNTIKYLYENSNPPCKIFSIGKVFRKENIDPTHLPEFYQIEGIIHEKNANFRQLIGILKEFYKRMGFEKIRFRPGYFPYTEPSMEIDVFYNNKWMELGGSGIFRPEVTEPIGVKNPVLAWGLGLERLAMLTLNLKDLRNIYSSDLDWLRNQSLI